MVEMPTTLDSLLTAIPADQLVSMRGDLSIEINAPVVESSQDVRPGGLFVARAGASTDGHRFVPDAIEAGAAAIIGEADLTDLPVPYVRVKNAQQILGRLAAAYNGYPTRRLVVIGVTGTDGKTTTCHLLHSILQRQPGFRVGYISTLSADFGDEAAPTGLHVTTPGAPQVHDYLKRMVDAGLTHCVLEMTSHGLAQGRLNGVDIDVAVLTNVTHEHLDFHDSWEDYRAAKAIMFRTLNQSFQKPNVQKWAIFNADDPSADYFAAIPDLDPYFVVPYGIKFDGTYCARRIRYLPNVTLFEAAGREIHLKLPGSFNVYNALAAFSAARVLGARLDSIKAGLDAVELIPGRMERIDEGQDFMAMVDFAHTPNALRRALEAGRQMLRPDNRLIAVFGSAGLRDVAKRRLMAETAADLADMTVLTAEDPRTESLQDILKMMAAGCIAQGGVEGETFVRVPDRGEAIYYACQLAQPGDLVMACGKGHEQSMCFGETEHPWDDREAMRSALRGAPLATLPTARMGSD